MGGHRGGRGPQAAALQGQSGSLPSSVTTVHDSKVEVAGC